MEANLWHHKLFHFHLSILNLERVQMKGKNYKKNEYLENKKGFLDKKYFS